MLRGRPGVVPAGLRGCASAAAGVYAQLMSLRNRAYDRGHLTGHTLPRPVVSVGNLSAGGTGKTPMVAYLVRELAGRGHVPAVLMRGYRPARPAVRGPDGRSTGATNDEADELAEAFRGLRGVCVSVDADRVRGAAAVLAASPDVDVFVLDDGFQHRRVRRDLDVVLVSARQGLCEGRVLPRGLLREPPEGLRRADVVVLTRVEPAADVSGLEAEVRRWVRADVPVLKCWHEVEGVESLDGERFAPLRLRGRRVFLVAATGDVGAFEASAVRLEAEIAGTWWGPDHHRYDQDDWDDIQRQARAAGASVILTTGKDATKLRSLAAVPAASATRTDDTTPGPAERPGEDGVPVWVLRVGIRFHGDDGAELLQRVERVIAARR